MGYLWMIYPTAAILRLRSISYEMSLRSGRTAVILCWCPYLLRSYETAFLRGNYTRVWLRRVDLSCSERGFLAKPRGTLFQRSLYGLPIQGYPAGLFS